MGLPHAPVQNRNGKNYVKLSKLQKEIHFFVMTAEHNLRTPLWFNQLNYIPQKQDIVGFSEITDLPKRNIQGKSTKI